MNMITRSAVPTNLDFEAARSTLLTLRSAGVSRAAILWALRARRSELNNVVNGIQPPSPELAARLGWLVMTDQLPEPPAWGDVPVTVTFGESKWDNSTTDTQTLTVAELAEVLTDHQDGDKEGRCIRPARFRGGRRTQDDADEISILMLDSDTGQTREELEAAVERLGLLAIISSTHSHLTTETEVSAKAWTEYRTANAGGTPEKFLVIEKGYQPNVAVGATVDREAAGRVFFRHQPCAKFRVTLLLAKPWRASDYPDQNTANAAWKACVEGAAAVLGLQHDQACTDTSRLFYLPRCPKGGPAPYSRVIFGNRYDAPELQKGYASVQAGMTRLPAKSRPHTPTRAIEYIDPETGQVFDLVAWAARYGSRFRITEPLRARAPGAFRNKISERTKHHIGCPFHDEHTDQKLDFATFVVNAGDSTAPGKGFTIHCRHAHCAERDRLEFVRQMLSDGWLTVNDLTNPAYLEPEVDPAEAAVDELNERRAMVMVGGKALVLTDTDADGRPTFELSRASDVRLWYDNDVVWVGGKPVSKFDLWRKHPRRRQFGAVKFAPASPPGAAAGSFYNLWRGFAVEPDPNGSCKLFLKHLADNACQGNEELSQWLLGWFAHMVQRPEERPETSTVFIGAQGTGKSIIGKFIGALFPPHYVSVSQSEQLLGKFNAHLKDALLIQAEEAFWAKDHKAEGVLKDITTNEIRMVEPKGVDPFPVRNHSRVNLTSNGPFVVPAAMEERRFAVFEFNEAHAQDRAYFAAMDAEMKNGGLGALLHVLQTFDLSTVDVRTIPRTNGLLSQKLANLQPHDAWWLACLREGVVGLMSEAWPESIGTQELYDAYRRHAKEVSNERYPIHETEFGRWLHKVAGVRRRRFRLPGQLRRYSYFLPPLDQCRASFDRRMGHALSWDEE